MPLPDSLPYGVLSQRSPQYLGEKRHQELDDLYVGGYQIADRAHHYLDRYIGEPEDRYRERLRCCGYVNYFATAVDFFVSNLFSQEITISPAADADDADTAGELPELDGYWTEFGDDVDLAGNDLAKFLRKQFSLAIVHGKSLVGVDFPRLSDDAIITSRADEDAFGVSRGYLVGIDPSTLVDWEYGSDGLFSWCVLRRAVQARTSPTDVRAGLVEEFKLWTIEAGRAVWDLYRTEPAKDGSRINPDTPIRRVDGGVTSFSTIPIRELVLPPGLWVGNKLGPLAREHYMRRTALVSAENRSLWSLPVVKLGPEMSAPGSPWPSEAQQNPERGHDPVAQFRASGFLVVGKDDSIEFAEPKGDAYKTIQEQIENLVDEMFRVVHQMAASISSTTVALGRSGDSKAEDRQATEVVLGAYGALVRDFATKLYALISDARGEDVVWTPHGLDRFSQDDRASVLEEAKSQSALDVPSLTFRKLYTTKLALALLGPIEPKTQLVIQREIEVAISEQDAAKDTLDAAMQRLTSRDSSSVDDDSDADTDSDEEDVDEPSSSKMPAAAPDQTSPAPTGIARINLTSTDIASIVRVNEARASQGLSPMPGPDGELTVAEFQAKHAVVVAAAANAAAGDSGDE